MDATYRVAIIGRTGAGDYGHDLDLAWVAHPDVEVVAVADEDPEGRAAAMARTGAAAGYADYREMLRREKPDFVSIGPRWVDCHAEMILACAEAGVRGVLCEKPFVRTPAEGDAVLQACARAGTRVAVAHQARVMPHVRRAVEFIRSGGIGRVEMLVGRGKGDIRGGAEDLFVLGTHILDLMRFLGGDPAWVSAHVQAGGRDITLADVHEGNEHLGPLAGDSVAALYAFPGGVTGLFHSRGAQGGSGRRFGLEVHGSEGILALRAGEAWRVFHYPHPYWPTTASVELSEWSSPEWEAAPRRLCWANRILVRDLVAAASEGRPPVSSGADGLWAVEMILGVFASQIAGARVPLPLADRGHPLAAWMARP